MEKVIGLVTCNYSAKESGPLSASRPVASMPFLGRYRLVDFALSNLVNSGIRTVGMVMPYNYRSLIDHVGSGKDWDLDRKNGGLFVLPGSAFGTSRTGARFLLRDLVHNKVFFTRSTDDAVILTSANFVYNIDLDEVYAAHKESGADVTVVTRPSCGTFDDAVRFDVENGRVKGVHNGVKFGECMFLDCFVISRKLLLDMFEWYAPTDYLDIFEAMAGDFGRINVQTFEFTGYVAPSPSATTTSPTWPCSTWTSRTTSSRRSAPSRPRRTTRLPPRTRWARASPTPACPPAAASTAT